MADTLNLLPCPFCGAALEGEIDDGASFHTHPEGDCIFSGWEFDQLNLKAWNRRSTSSVSEGEMPELPKAVTLGWACDSSSLPMGYTADMVREYARAAIAADRRARQGESVDVQRYTNNGDGTMVENPEGVWCYYEDATKAAAPADAPKLDADELARLRRVVRALDMEKAVPQDDATLSGCLFSVLGMIAYELERRASSVPTIQGTGREKEWIETKKQKPEPGQWCIINIRTHYVNAPARDSVSAARYDGYNWCADSHHLYEPTHWMPFPAAPTHPSEAKAGEDAPKSCWSCGRMYTAEQRLDADGNCPHCGVEIEEAAAPSHPLEAKTCTCPSGDGSLRWPCPVHPSEAKAGECPPNAYPVAGIGSMWDTFVEKLEAEIGGVAPAHPGEEGSTG